MSLVFRTFECPDCDGRFELMQERDDAPPRFCLHCGADFGADESHRPEAVPAKIAIGGGSAARSVDQTYRMLEESSAARAEAVGNPALKITDLHDNLREGDVAAKVPAVPNNSIGQFMRYAEETAGIHYGFQKQAFAPDVRAPPIRTSAGQFSGPTNVALDAVQGVGGENHQRTKQQLTAAGETPESRALRTRRRR